MHISSYNTLVLEASNTPMAGDNIHCHQPLRFHMEA